MIQMNAEELAMDHIERANIIRHEMCGDSNSLHDEEIEDGEMESMIKLAEDMAMHYRTAMLLRSLVKAVTVCPECGTDLTRFYRPTKSMPKRAR